MSRCHNCGYSSSSCTCVHACNECDPCIKKVKGKCVFYQGANLDCIDVTKGDDYDAILVKLNDLICDILPPSGISTVVNSCSSSIVVTSATADDVTTYTVCLDSDITDQITENTNDILVLQECVTSGVYDLVSDSLTITTETEGECGKTLRLEVITPSGVPTYDGIVNNTADGNSSSGTGVQILTTVNRDYVTLNDFTTGDEIRFAFEGSISSPSVAPGSIIFEIFDANTATIIYSFTESTLQVNAGAYSWELIGSIRHPSPTGNSVSAHFNIHSQPQDNYGSFYTPMRGVIRKSITGLDYSNLSLRIKVNIADASATISNNIQMVEVRKYIG